MSSNTSPSHIQKVLIPSIKVVFTLLLNVKLVKEFIYVLKNIIRWIHQKVNVALFDAWTINIKLQRRHKRQALVGNESKNIAHSWE